MNRRERDELKRYVRALGDQCELRDWTIRLVIAEPAIDHEVAEDEEVLATMQCAIGRKLGVLTVPPDVRDTDPRDLRHTLAHELVHCHLDGLWKHLTHEAVATMLGAGAASAFGAAAEFHLEHAVDAIASALAPSLPLIRWPAR